MQEICIKPQKLELGILHNLDFVKAKEKIHWAAFLPQLSSSVADIMQNFPKMNKLF